MDCSENTDALKLVREGTSRTQRATAALRPSYAPVNERTPAHLMVFSRAFAEFIRFYDETNTPSGNWQRFFADDVSITLAAASVENVDGYALRVQETIAFLNDFQHQADTVALTTHIGNLFSMAASLAKQIDRFKNSLPPETGLRNTISNLIQTQSAMNFKRLIAYYKAGQSLSLVTDVPPSPEVKILGDAVVPFSTVMSAALSADWIADGTTDWAAYVTSVAADATVYGKVATPFDRINHIATHSLFKSALDQLLKMLLRISAESKKELAKTIGDWNTHEPYMALFLSFLQLNEYAREETNTLTARHLDYYYREVLRLKERPSVAGQAHVLLELAKQVDSYLLPHASSLKAGKDSLGKEVIFDTTRDVVVNKAKVTALKTLYRHKNNTVRDTLSGMDRRLFASPVSNSGDGLGSPILSDDQSWQPFFNRRYNDGDLISIDMPEATIGFAVASHYLYMAEGSRKVTLAFTTTGVKPAGLSTTTTCMLTTAKGWWKKTCSVSAASGSSLIIVTIDLSGNDPAIVPYNEKIHGYHFAIALPVLVVQSDHNSWDALYPDWQDTPITSLDLTVEVNGLRSMAVSNDFGPVDTSKPFLPFGPSPIVNSSLVFGSKELFQKNLDAASVLINWQVNGKKYGATSKTLVEESVKAGHGKTAPRKLVRVSGTSDATISFLQNGTWGNSEDATLFSSGKSVNVPLDSIGGATNTSPDFTTDEILNTGSANGYGRISLNADFGQFDYQIALRNYLIAKAHDPSAVDTVGEAPSIPVALDMSVNYTATQHIDLSSMNEGDFLSRSARFFYVGPFGEAEAHAQLSDLSLNKVYLVPHFSFQREDAQKEIIDYQSNAEFYIGVTDLQPPRNLSLLFQVLDGSADPLAAKPDPHIHWSYLRANEWVAFSKEEIEDATTGLTRSGIITLSVPQDASVSNTILPAGMHWLRLAVFEKPEAVCKLLLIAAQAVLTQFTDNDNDPAFSDTIVGAGTISKLSQPVAAIRKVTQPFDEFGGRGGERPEDFYQRISERLRHKDRAIELWDYERLVLEAFPSVFRAKCLNHTEYEPTDDGLGSYRELAPGHVTFVTIPDQKNQNVRNPLKPYTSLGTLLEVKAFLQKRMSCFIHLHVKNPQFEEVQTNFKVRFFPGIDETYFTVKLKEEITRFLSPWAYPGGASPSFGGKIYKSTLVNFVEERDYVDYVADFILVQKIPGSSGFSGDLPMAVASTAVSILVSVPASQHKIESLKTDTQAVAEDCSCTP